MMAGFCYLRDGPESTFLSFSFPSIKYIDLYKRNMNIFIK